MGDLISLNWRKGVKNTGWKKSKMNLWYWVRIKEIWLN